MLADAVVSMLPPGAKLDMIKDLVVSMFRQLDECPKGLYATLEALTSLLGQIQRLKEEREADEVFMANVKRCEETGACDYKPEGHEGNKDAQEDDGNGGGPTIQVMELPAGEAVEALIEKLLGGLKTKH